MLAQSALVVEGGAMRSVFSAGLLDGFLAKQFNPFDLYIGVSAGAYNLVNYLEGDSGKSLKIFQNFFLHGNLISYSRFIRGGHLIDLDRLVQISFSEAYDSQPVFNSIKPLYICTTDVASGKAVYTKVANNILQDVMKATLALPVFYRNLPEIHGRPMTDGGVSQGIPVAEAIRMGAKKIMVVRSRHKHYLKKDTLGHKYIRWKMRAHPALLATMRKRIDIHKDSIALIRKPPKGVKIVEICPPEDFSIGRFNRNIGALLQGYQTGYETAKQAMYQWTND